MSERRKHITLKTKLASALLALGHVTYNDAKKLTEDQLIRKYQWDHNILHETGHLDRDKYWNLTPMLIEAHRLKTKSDQKLIAKGRRLRRGALQRAASQGDATPRIATPRIATIKRANRGVHLMLDGEETGVVYRYKKIQSRGFDRRFKRKIDGTVVKRDG